MDSRNGKTMPLDGSAHAGYNGRGANGRIARTVPPPEVLLGRHAEALCQIIAGIVRRIMTEDSEAEEDGAGAAGQDEHDEQRAT